MSKIQNAAAIALQKTGPSPFYEALYSLGVKEGLLMASIERGG